MKIFYNLRTGQYSGGMIVVAANSPEEAHHTMMLDDNIAWSSDPLDEDSNVIEDRDKWTHWYYKKENWLLMNGATYNGPEPKILAESGYSE